MLAAGAIAGILAFTFLTAVQNLYATSASVCVTVFATLTAAIAVGPLERSIDALQ